MNSPYKLQANSFPALIALLLGGAALAQGCGGDDNPIPTPIATGATGGGGNGGTGGKGNTSGSSGESEAGNPGDEGGTGNDGSGATGGTGNNGSGGTGNDGSGGTGNTGQGGEGAEGNEGGGGNEPGDDCSVRGTNNCYRCEPQALDPAPAFPRSANEQFLNRCDDSKGARFVNEERIPGFTGTDNLPALP